MPSGNVCAADWAFEAAILNRRELLEPEERCRLLCRVLWRIYGPLVLTLPGPL